MANFNLFHLRIVKLEKKYLSTNYVIKWIGILLQKRNQNSIVGTFD